MRDISGQNVSFNWLPAPALQPQQKRIPRQNNPHHDETTREIRLDKKNRRIQVWNRRLPCQAEKIWRQPTLAEAIQPLPSARLRLTAEFGMGSGRAAAL
jgi:hypothetical protein